MGGLIDFLYVRSLFFSIKHSKKEKSDIKILGLVPYYRSCIFAGAKNVAVGDITERLNLRDKLKCKSFRWYLSNVYPDSTMPLDYYFLGDVSTFYWTVSTYSKKFEKHGTLTSFLYFALFEQFVFARQIQKARYRVYLSVFYIICF